MEKFHRIRENKYQIIFSSVLTLNFLALLYKDSAQNNPLGVARALCTARALPSLLLTMATSLHTEPCVTYMADDPCNFPSLGISPADGVVQEVARKPYLMFDSHPIIVYPSSTPKVDNKDNWPFCKGSSQK